MIISPTTRKTSWLPTMLILASLFGLVSCVRPLIGYASYVNRSVKSNNALLGGYVIGQVYQLTRETSIQKKQVDSSYPVLESTGDDQVGGYWDRPKSKAEYSTNPGKYPDVLGFIPAGTKLMCVDIRERGFRVTETTIEVVAIVCEGQFKEVKVVLDDISKKVPSPEDDVYYAARRAARTDPTVEVGKPPLVPRKPDRRFIVPCE